MLPSKERNIALYPIFYQLITGANPIKIFTPKAKFTSVS